MECVIMNSCIVEKSSDINTDVILIPRNFIYPHIIYPYSREIRPQHHINALTIPVTVCAVFTRPGAHQVTPCGTASN
jgi:hypothetical protein